MEELIESDINFKLNSCVTKFVNKESKVVIQINNEEEIIADFLIGADGINSSIRTLLFPNEKCIKAHNVIFSTFTINDVFKEPLMGNEEFIGKGKLFGIYPYSNNKYGIYASINQSVNQPIINNLETLKSNFKDFGEKVNQVFDKMDNTTSIYSDFIKEVKLNKWYNGRVVLIGDAAHAMLPTTGQGLSSAMEDAYELYQTLFNKPITSTSTIDFDLDLFQKKRRKKMKPIIISSKINHYMLMNENSIICKIRNLVLQYLPHSEKKLDKFFEKDLIIKKNINGE